VAAGLVIGFWSFLVVRFCEDCQQCLCIAAFCGRTKQSKILMRQIAIASTSHDIWNNAVIGWPRKNGVAGGVGWDRK